MKSVRCHIARICLALALSGVVAGTDRSLGAEEPAIQVGIAVRAVTPEGPIWLAGYAARKRPSEKSDSPLMAQAIAFKSGDERVVLVSLDNCEVSREFMAPVLQELGAKHGPQTRCGHHGFQSHALRAGAGGRAHADVQPFSRGTRPRAEVRPTAEGETGGRGWRRAR